MKATFRLYSVRETHAWLSLPHECRDVFGVYLFREGEAAHLCSLTPSTDAEFVRNEFIGLDGEHPFAEEYGQYNGGELGTYFHFIDPERERENVSEPVEVETDKEGEEGRAALWEEAGEIVRGNYYTTPAITAAWAAAGRTS